MDGNEEFSDTDDNVEIDNACENEDESTSKLNFDNDAYDNAIINNSVPNVKNSSHAKIGKYNFEMLFHDKGKGESSLLPSLPKIIFQRYLI